jgi:hypothetical protein
MKKTGNKELELWEHQKNILDKNPDYQLLAWDPGIGKTLGSLKLAKKNGGSTMAITPKGLKDKWVEEIKFLDGETKVVTKEFFRDNKKDIKRFDNIIIDEAHRNWAAWNQSSRALFWWLKKHKPDRIWLLTATPYCSTPMNVYYLGKICRYTPYSAQEFKSRFFYKKWIGRKQIDYPLLKNPSKEKRIDCQRRLHEYMLNFSDIVKRDDVFDVPDQQFIEEQFDYTKSQEVAMAKLDKFLTNRGTFFGYAHQIASGYLNPDSIQEEIDISSGKIDRLLDLSEDFPVVLIYSRYHQQQEDIRAALQKKYPKAWVKVLNGDNSSESTKLSEKLNSTFVKNKEDVLDNRAYLIASTGVAEGWQCVNVNQAIYMSLPWGYKDFIQSRDRILRSNNLKENIYRIFLTGRVDKQIYKNLKNGEDIDPKNYEPSDYS